MRTTCKCQRNGLLQNACHSERTLSEVEGGVEESVLPIRPGAYHAPTERDALVEWDFQRHLPVGTALPGKAGELSGRIPVSDRNP